MAEDEGAVGAVDFETVGEPDGSYRDSIGGMRIVTVTVVVRAGDPDWADIDTTCEVDVEPGWPVEIALAAAMGGLRSAKKAVKGARDEGLRPSQMVVDSVEQELEVDPDAEVR